MLAWHTGPQVNQVWRKHGDASAYLDGTGSYSFASQPQAVRSRGKFREQAESPQTGADGRNAINIMW